MNTCSNVVTIPQYGESCWFNAIMMAIFYSDGMRKLLMSKLPTWDTSKKSKQMMKEILLKRYTHSNHEFMGFFNTFRPETLLGMLHEEDHNYFELDPSKGVGYFSGRYMHKLIRYLGIESMSILDALETHNTHNTHKPRQYNFYYGQYNKMFVAPKTYAKTFLKASPQEASEYLSRVPDVLLVMTKKGSDAPFYPAHYYKGQIEFKPSIIFNGKEYVADSMILSNFNQGTCHMGHEICGLTCKGIRFMYNGWMQHTHDKGMKNQLFGSVPCALMKHDWLNPTQQHFCISKDCGLTYHSNTTALHKNMCFSYGKGPRIYTYIRKDLLQKDVLKAPTKPVLKTLVMKAKEAIPKIPLKTNITETNPKKVCPEGKVINPKTGRCIKVQAEKTEKAKKVCPEGKVINPKTGRCIKAPIDTKHAKLTKPTKPCPDDKILNPKTNRCVKRTSQLGKSIMLGTS